MNFNDDILLWLARIIGILGLSLLVLSSVGGVLLASHTTQKIKAKWLKGKIFKYHRLLSIIGASLFLLHPIPMVFANQTTAMQWFHIFVPFTAPKQTLMIAIGTIAAYALLIVTISSLYIKYMNRGVWRILHYGTYLFLALGLIHGLFISGEFKAGEVFEFEEPEKLFLLFLAAVTFLFPLWRVVIARQNKLKKPSAL